MPAGVGGEELTTGQGWSNAEAGQGPLNRHSRILAETRRRAHQGQHRSPRSGQWKEGLGEAWLKSEGENSCCARFMKSKLCLFTRLGISHSDQTEKQAQPPRLPLPLGCRLLGFSYTCTTMTAPANPLAGKASYTAASQVR